MCLTVIVLATIAVFIFQKEALATQKTTFLLNLENLRISLKFLPEINQQVIICASLQM